MVLHFYYSPVPWNDTTNIKKLNAGFVEWLRDKGIIVKADLGHGETERLTPLGEAWVRSILMTPIPRMVFIDRMDNIIPDEVTPLTLT